MPVACRSCPGVRARRARRAAASVAPAVPAVTAAPAAPVAPAPHTGIPTRRVSRRDPPTSRFRRGPPERLLVDSGIQKCHGCVGDPRLTPKMRGSTYVPRADGDPQLSIGDPGTTFHRTTSRFRVSSEMTERTQFLSCCGTTAHSGICTTTPGYVSTSRGRPSSVRRPGPPWG